MTSVVLKGAGRDVVGRAVSASRACMFHDHIPADYLHDESRLIGSAEAIAFPRSVAELAEDLRTAARRGLAVTVQGARTGIAAGATPDGGAIVNLSRMDRFLGFNRSDASAPLLRAQPGVALSALRRHLDAEAKPYFFAPDPTEPSATLGGMAACNASGACSFAYGPTRDHLHALTVVLADGDSLTLRRGGARARDRRFELITAGGRRLAGDLPTYTPPAVKNAAGYWVQPNMDLLDLFVGSEGTLGIIAELEVRLIPRPARTIGILGFFKAEPDAIAYAIALRHFAPEARPDRLTAIEYFDPGALMLVRDGMARSGMPIPSFRPAWQCAVYAEWASATPDEDPHAALSARLLASCNGHPDETWLAADEPSILKLKAFRHAAPERANAMIAERRLRYPDLTKLGSDFSVPDNRLEASMRMYGDDLKKGGFQYAIFGHIGNNHLHVNILPRNPQEYAAGRALLQQWAQQVVAWGGSVSAEHGIGRLKRELLAIMAGPAGLDAMRRLKACFDPENRLNPGRLFLPRHPESL